MCVYCGREIQELLPVYLTSIIVIAQSVPYDCHLVLSGIFHNLLFVSVFVVFKSGRLHFN